MGTRFLTDMADVLRRAGLKVTEQDGWQTRARRSGGFDGNRPWCVMWHHAASAPGTTTENVAYYASFGASVAPVCNLVVGRTGDVIVCAAGATNTNGAGGRVDATHPAITFSRGMVPEDQMNTHAIGIEAVNTGVGQPWPQGQIDAYFKINNALAAAYGLKPTDCCTHSLWSPGRKIDPATAAAVEGPWQPRDIGSAGSWSLTDIRSEANRRDVPPNNPTENKVDLVEIAVAGRQARFLGYLIKPITTAPGGGTAQREFILWAEWVNGGDPIQTARLQAYRNMGIQVYNVGDMTGIGLLGPLPVGDALHTWTRDDFGNLL
jgi:hypothetical protein